MTITIDVAGSSLVRLQSEADRLGVSVEQLAKTVIERHTDRPEVGTLDEITFRKLMTDTFRENDELYRRLAK